LKEAFLEYRSQGNESASERLATNFTNYTNFFVEFVKFVARFSRSY